MVEYEPEIDVSCFIRVLEKYCQNKELTELLLATGDAILAECSVKDKIWGIGLNMRDNDRFDIKKWKGQNLLGFALMEVRKCLVSHSKIKVTVK